MLIDLSEFLSQEGKTKNLTVDIEMEYFAVDFAEYKLQEKKPVELTLTNIGKKNLLIDAFIELVLLMPCDRCLKDVKTNLKLNISKEIDMNESDLDRLNKLDESSFLEGNFLNVEKFVQNEILIELPMKVLCNADCKGICNRCGEDLNLHTCSCDATELDPRMSKILDVFNANKEV